MLDVVQAVEPAGGEAPCVLNERLCSWRGPCPLHATVAAAEAACRHELRERSLADLAPGVPVVAGATADAGRP